MSNYKPLARSYAECFNKKALPAVADFNIRAEAELHRLINVANVESTLKAAGVSFLAYLLTARFSIFSLLCTSIVLAFTGPFVYTTFKTEIDSAVEKYYSCAKSQACKYVDQAKSAAKPHVDTALALAEPVLKHVRAFLPDTHRTAGSNVKPEDDAPVDVAAPDVTADLSSDADATIAYATGSTKGASEDSTALPRQTAGLQVVDEIKTASESGPLK